MLAQINGALALGIEDVLHERHRNGSGRRTVPPAFELGAKVEHPHFAALQ